MKNRYSADIEYLTVGLDHAKVEVEAFVNLGCPYCQTFFEVIDEVLKPYADDGYIKLVLKHVDRTKSKLLRGTVANNYVDHDDPIEGYNTMKELFMTQDSWSDSFKDTINKCENDLGLPELKAQYDRGEEVLKDFNERGLRIVPTVFINGEQVDYKPKELSKDEVAELFKNKIEPLK